MTEWRYYPKEYGYCPKEEDQMAKEPIFKNGKLNLRAWDSDLACRETGKRSVDRQTVAQVTEIRALIMDDLKVWSDSRGREWPSFWDRMTRWDPVARKRRTRAKQKRRA